MDKWKIMVVEDDAPVRRLITASLSAEDYTVVAAGTAAEAGSGADNAGKVGSEEAAGVREREWRRRLLI